MGDVAIVSACYGGSDTIRHQAPQEIVDVDWILFTDDPLLEAPAPWNVIVKPLDDPPNLAAKRFKLRPAGSVPHPNIIWIDANMAVTSETFAREALAARHDGIATWRHPRRDCIYDEARASVGAESQGGKYDGLPILEQADHYRADGYPAHAGLYACGTIAWDTTDRRALELGAAWLAECEQWTIQDQISLPVVARRLGVEPGVFPHPQIDAARSFRGYLGNRWLRIYPHKVPA